MDLMENPLSETRDRQVRSLECWHAISWPSHDSLAMAQGNIFQFGALAN